MFGHRNDCTAIIRRSAAANINLYLSSHSTCFRSSYFELLLIDTVFSNVFSNGSLLRNLTEVQPVPVPLLLFRGTLHHGAVAALLSVTNRRSGLISHYFQLLSRAQGVKPFHLHYIRN